VFDSLYPGALQSNDYSVPSVRIGLLDMLSLLYVCVLLFVFLKSKLRCVHESCPFGHGTAFALVIVPDELSSVS
jgi:hypothetical protein